MCVGVPIVLDGSVPGSDGSPSGKPLGSWPSTSMCAMFSPRRSAEFQWFLTALSVRPGRYLAMSAHLLPNSSWSCMSLRSSSSDQADLLMSWSRWLCQRSRHCLPVRPGSDSATVVHARVPCWCTRARTVSSSSWVHCLRCVPDPRAATSSSSASIEASTIWALEDPASLIASPSRECATQSGWEPLTANAHRQLNEKRYQTMLSNKTIV